MECLVEFSENDPRAVPMHMLVLAAIFLSYWQGEHTRLLWDEVNADSEDDETTLLIRNMKHPRKKEGNIVEVQVREEGLAVIRAMARNSDRIFPFNSEPISRRFTEACKMLGIKNLHFRDLRHEGNSRMFEEAPGVDQTSLHKMVDDAGQELNLIGSQDTTCHAVAEILLRDPAVQSAETRPSCGSASNCDLQPGTCKMLLEVRDFLLLGGHDRRQS